MLKKQTNKQNGQKKKREKKKCPSVEVEPQTINV